MGEMVVIAGIGAVHWRPIDAGGGNIPHSAKMVYSAGGHWQGGALCGGVGYYIARGDKNVTVHNSIFKGDKLPIAC